MRILNHAVLLALGLGVGCGSEEQDLVGTYEGKVGDSTSRFILLEGGVVRIFKNDKRKADGKWSTSHGEVVMTGPKGEKLYFKVESSRALTGFGQERNGRLEELPKDKQVTFNKVD